MAGHEFVNADCKQVEFSLTPSATASRPTENAPVRATAAGHDAGHQTQASFDCHSKAPCSEFG